MLLVDELVAWGIVGVGLYLFCASTVIPQESRAVIINTSHLMWSRAERLCIDIEQKHLNLMF